ncbi:MAG: hypothetical protein ACM3O3_00020 [Syntrophothermus sp.]
MVLLKRSDLLFNYTWTALEPDNPRISGQPDSTLFNRKEGYEVLYLINKIGEQNYITDKLTGLKIETLIKTKLPSYIRTQNNVVGWVKEQIR